MSLRRFRIKASEYANVIKWVRVQKADEAEDEKSPEPLALKGFRMPTDYLPRVAWAHRAPMRITKAAHGKEHIEVLEGDTWKRVVHEGALDDYLRDALLSKASDVPMSRDAGYHIVQKRVVGISRRAFAKFLGKQAVIQITKDAVPQKKSVGRPLEGRGYAEIDLVEAKGRDIGKFLHKPTKNFYWITFIDRLTGWLEVHRILSKDFGTVVPAIRKMVHRMQKALKAPVKYIRSDSGSEFKSKTKEMLASLGIQHRFVKSAGRLEQANKTYQKIWYRLLRLGRGSTLNELDHQAVAIFNNTISSITGHTPLEAIGADDRVLVQAYKSFKAKTRKAKYKVVPIAKGDRCRYLLDAVRGKNAPKAYELGYKSYRGKHWSAGTHVVVKYNRHNEKYYVGGAWRARDKLLKVQPVDVKTQDRVAGAHKKLRGGAQKAGYEW